MQAKADGPASLETSFWLDGGVLEPLGLMAVKEGISILALYEMNPIFVRSLGYIWNYVQGQIRRKLFLGGYMASFAEC